MSAEYELFLLGLSHKTASVEVRERCSLDPEAVDTKLAELASLRDVSEVWLLSTCNRTEVLAVVDRVALDSGAAEGVLRQAVFEQAPEDVLYAFRGVESVIHLFRVTSGLESLVLGESQIYSQIKEAVTHARAAGTCKRVLEPLLKRALVTGKRVRNETAVGSGTLSVARAGVGIAQHVVGRFDDVNALIVGAGETGRLVARHLKDLRVGRLTFANRTPENATRAAAELGGVAASLDNLPELILESDLVVACVDGAPDLIGIDRTRAKKLGSRDRPLVIIDLSVPRAVHPDLSSLKHVFAYDMDDVAKLVDTNQRAREAAGEEAAPILVAEVHKFLSLRTYARFSPAITRLRERFDTVREEELDAIAGDHASSEMVQLAHKLTGHLLDVALDGLKESARETVGHETLESAYQRFLRGQ